MTEADYIAASNLARVRDIRELLRHVTPMTPADKERVRQLSALLADWEEHLSDAITPLDVSDSTIVRVALPSSKPSSE